MAVQDLLDKDSGALTGKAVELALGGGTTAQDAAAAVRAVSQGDFTQLEGASVMVVVEVFRKALIYGRGLTGVFGETPFP